MVYVEWLRVRKGLAIYLAVVLVGLVFFVSTVHVGGTFSGHVGSGGDGHSWYLGSASPPAANDAPAAVSLPELLHRLAIPLGALFTIASVLAALFAFARATSLNAQRDSLDIVFTQPVRRERLALSVAVLDAAAIVVAFLALLGLVCFAPLAYFGLLGNIVTNENTLPLAVLALGAPLMLYGVFQALTAWYRSGPFLIVGIGVVVFFFAVVLGGLSLGALSALFALIRPIDPLNYYVAMFEGSFVVVPGSGAALASMAIVEWIVAIVATGIATVGWSRAER